MQVSDNFVRANGSIGSNWTTPVTFAGGGSGAGGIQLLNNAFAPVTTAGSASMSLWNGTGAGSFATSQYAQAKISVLAPSTSVVAITATAISASNTTYTYTLSSGSALVVNQQIIITGMPTPGNNGNFQITSLGAGTFTVVNASGANVTESGTGTSPSDSNCGLVVRGTADGLNGYFLYIGTNSGLVANGGVMAGADARTQDVELWKVVNGVPTILAGNGGINFTSLVTNDVFTLIASGTKLTVIQNATVVYQTTDVSLSAGSPGIMTWSVGGVGEWANPTTWAVGNSGTQMTNWIGGDDSYSFNQLTSDTLKEGTSLTQVASDNFTRANGGLGANWVTSAGSLQIVSNKVEVVSTGTLRNASYWGGGQTFSNDQYAEATVSVINNTALGGPQVRGKSTGVNGTASETGYILLIPATGASGNVIIQRVVNGASTNISTIPTITPNVGDVFRISIVGTTITALKNGVSIGTVVDATITTGLPGIFIFPGSAITDCQFSSWAAGGVGAPSTFSTRVNENWMSDATVGASANVVTTAPFAGLWKNTITWPADQYSELKLTGATAGIGPSIRLATSSDTGYFFIFGGASTAKLGKVVAGVVTTLVTQAYTFVSGDVFRIEAKGTTIVCKINGVIVCVLIDSAIASGNAGLASLTASSSASGSDWAAGSVSTVYSYPDDRAYSPFPNLSVNVQGTLVYTVPNPDSRTSPNIPVDSRTSPNIPVDSRTSPNIPTNSRNTPT